MKGVTKHMYNYICFYEVIMESMKMSVDWVEQIQYRSQQ